MASDGDRSLCQLVLHAVPLGQGGIGNGSLLAFASFGGEKKKDREKL